MKRWLTAASVLFAAAVLTYGIYHFYHSPVVSVLSIIFSLTALFVGLVIFFENRHPSSTIAWLVVLAIFPVVGFFVYVLIGQSYRKKKMFYRKGQEDEEMILRNVGEKLLPADKISKMGENQQLLFQLTHNLSKSPISFATQTKVLTNGKEKFSHLLEALAKAKDHIHLEYYIVRDDNIGQDIKKVLIHKAKQGVEVRFLYDAVGSIRLSNKYIHELREAGVKMVPFFPVKLPFFNQKINFRNHRKIVVIDGQSGFVGGLNIGDEYLGKHSYYGHWRDTHLWVKGEAVRSLQLIFLQDWYHMTGESLLTPRYLSPSLMTESEENFGGVQMIAGGPDSEWEVIKHLYFSMINSARHSIWIASPYFIPDDEILTSLKIAALSGVDVRILVPDRPDKKTVFYASRSYFPDLLKAGVKIFEYKKGFLHSKIVMVDEELASIGTSNMDMRSFHLNFEINAFLYQTDSIRQLANDFQLDFKESNQLNADQFNSRRLRYRIFESLSRLLSPLL